METQNSQFNRKFAGVSFTYLSSLAGPRSCLPPIADVCRITAGLINSRNGAKNSLRCCVLSIYNNVHMVQKNCRLYNFSSQFHNFILAYGGYRDGVLEDWPRPRGQLEDKILWPWPWPRRLLALALALASTMHSLGFEICW